MSTLHANTIETSSGGPVTLTKQTATKYWVHIDGTGTVSIRGSFNTSTITDNGTGEYTGNFTNNFDSTDNMSAPRGGSFTNISGTATAHTRTQIAATSSLEHHTYRSDDTVGDTDNNTQSCLGDLA